MRTWPLDYGNAMNIFQAEEMLVRPQCWSTKAGICLVRLRE